jgi:conjugative transfer region protein (TIGR03748 family)
MPAIRFQCPAEHLFLATGLLIAAFLPAGCTTSSVASLSISSRPEAHTQPLSDGWIPVTRYGRYTLVELSPEIAQQDLFMEVIDVSTATPLPATVGDALQYMLLHTGYVLCENDPEAAVLYALPLPAAHLQLGPLFLRDALLTLAGPAWRLEVDDLTRRVCFSQRSEALP